jgi:hypothetical protein
MLMFSGATSKFAELFLSSQMSWHNRCTGELKKKLAYLLNVLPLPPKTRFHQAAAATKLAAAATLPPPRFRCLRRHCAANAANAALLPSCPLCPQANHRR